MGFYIGIIIGSLLIYTVFIYFLAKNISNNIVNVSNSLRKISEKGKDRERSKIAIFSNDEIGDLYYYKIEANGITSALERTYQLYEVLNFETLNEIDLRGLKDIISILLKPTLLINSKSLQFDINDEGIIINNASNKIYIIIKALEILTRNDAKIIRLKMDENKFKICFDKEVNVDLLNDLKILE